VKGLERARAPSSFPRKRESRGGAASGERPRRSPPPPTAIGRALRGFSAPINKKPGARPGSLFIGGERGIRTLDTLLTYTRFPGVLLQPLGHLTSRVVDFTCFQIERAPCRLSVRAFEVGLVAS